MEINNLNTSWTYWFHKYNDDKWDLESYTKLYKFDSVEEFAALQIILKPKHIQNGMFFLMRNDILCQQKGFHLSFLFHLSYLLIYRCLFCSSRDRVSKFGPGPFF